MDTTHITAFVEAMARKDLETMLSHMSDDIVLKTPLVAQPFRGKAALRPVVSALLAVVDTFEFREMMDGPEHVSEFFGVTVGAEALDGMDFFRLDADGLIRELTVFWRPLPAIVAVQAKLDAAD